MTTTLDGALKAIQDIVGRVEGIRAAPEYATDKVPPGTWSMAFPINGGYSQNPPNVLKGMHNIGLYVYGPRVDLRQTLMKIIPLGDKVAAAIEKEPKLLNTVKGYSDITYEFNMALNVGTVSAPAYVTGWSFILTDVRIDDTEVLV